MSVYSNHVRKGSNDSDRSQLNRINADEYENEFNPKKEKLPNIVPELSKLIRKLLPNEFLLNIHVRNVEYYEYGCPRLTGTLYMTIFRLVFAPDNEIETNPFILSGNKYIGEYDIPLTSIYRIHVVPIDSRVTRRVLRSEQLGQTESRTFTILTRDFRSITFSKSSTRRSSSSLSKVEISLTKMETFIDALKFHARFQDKGQLYPYIATQKSTNNDAFVINEEDCPTNSIQTQSLSDNLEDFCTSNDERIRSYLIYQDWYEILQEANDHRWIVDEKKFNARSIAQDESPFVRFKSINGENTSKDWIWHWTHTTEFETDNTLQYMLMTVPDVGEITTANDSHRRSNVKGTLMFTNHSIHGQSFQRYNLSKFPCSLKKLETSYEKLLEICVNMEEEDEEWLTKLEGCQWLSYVSKALHGAASLAKLLNYKNIQLIGSDLDHSCLMSSLIQIFLRATCRTIKGFCELIVREWIIRGHPFRERFGQVISDGDRSPAQESPIFLLFLDCVQQLIHQNPFLFEFTEYFLIEIYHSVCFCYHHTFAFNSVFERLTAINQCPPNLLVLSVFDFSLYLQREFQYRLKNQASISSPSRPVPINPSRTRMSLMHGLLKQTLTLPRSKPRPNISLTPPPVLRRTYRLELPKSDIPLNSKEFEYDDIEAPQKFSSDLSVDWRLISLVLWSNCYCRYEQNSILTFAEQELTQEIGSLEEQIANTQNKDREAMKTDAFHSINYANSWYPQLFVTRV